MTYALWPAGLAAILAMGATVTAFAIALLADDPALWDLLGYLFEATGAVSVVIWLWRASANATAFPEADISIRPAWAIWGWVIPGVNLIMPIRLVTQVVRNSMPTSKLHQLAPLWWVTYLTAGWMVYVLPYERPTFVIRVALIAAAGGLLSLIIARVTRAQETRIHGLPDAMAQPVQA